jgi:hypothetical protein
MTSLFVELPWSRKAVAQHESGPAEKAANDGCKLGQRTSSEGLFRFRREDGLPHAL